MKKVLKKMEKFGFVNVFLFDPEEYVPANPTDFYLLLKDMKDRLWHVTESLCDYSEEIKKGYKLEDFPDAMHLKSILDTFEPIIDRNEHFITWYEQVVQPKSEETNEAESTA